MLSLWWVSWFGIISGFLWVSVWEVKIEFSRGRISRLSLAILLVVLLSWVCFFIVDSKTKVRTRKVVTLLTLVGTSLAVFTLLGIWFFIVSAGRS